MKGYIFINGASEVGIDYDSNKFYVNADIINKDGYDYFMEVTREKFIEVLETTFKWVNDCWDKELIKEYKEILKYAKEV